MSKCRLIPITCWVRESVERLVFRTVSGTIMKTRYAKSLYIAICIDSKPRDQNVDPTHCMMLYTCISRPNMNSFSKVSLRNRTWSEIKYDHIVGKNTPLDSCSFHFKSWPPESFLGLIMESFVQSLHGRMTPFCLTEFHQPSHFAILAWADLDCSRVAGSNTSEMMHRLVSTSMRKRKTKRLWS